MNRLENRVAIVTGGGGYIGGAVASLFAKEGAAVVVADLAGDRAEACAKQIVAEGGRAIAIQFDLCKKAEIDAMVAQVIKTYGQVDILANIGGLTGHGGFMRFLDIDEAALEAELGSHTRGTFFCNQAVAPHMIERQYGKIINTASMSGISGHANAVHYSSAKAGIIGMTYSLAMALGPDCINVNCIAPGARRPGAKTTSNPVFTERATWPPRKIDRSGPAEDVAPGYLFFASSDSDACHGQLLNVSNTNQHIHDAYNRIGIS
jgi:3-oxoacyl-[acyl-carrier protein] reductase